MFPEDEETEGEFAPSVRWQWSFLALRTVETMGNVLSALASGVSSVAHDIACQCNHEIDRRTFAANAGAAIEAITEEGSS